MMPIIYSQAGALINETFPAKTAFPLGILVLLAGLISGFPSLLCGGDMLGVCCNIGMGGPSSRSLTGHKAVWAHSNGT